jgi:hypothetical protein
MTLEGFTNSEFDNATYRTDRGELIIYRQRKDLPPVECSRFAVGQWRQVLAVRDD